MNSKAIAEKTTQSREWRVIRKACQTTEELEALEEAIREGWQPDEIMEYARIYWHAPGLDYATPGAIREAVLLAQNVLGTYFLSDFRGAGRIPAPPREKASLYAKRRKPKLAPQYNRNWEGHTDEFREEVAQKAREDRHLPPGSYVGPQWWKIACNKHYELTED